MFSTDLNYSSANYFMVITTTVKLELALSMTNPTRRGPITASWSWRYRHCSTSGAWTVTYTPWARRVKHHRAVTVAVSFHFMMYTGIHSVYTLVALAMWTEQVTGYIPIHTVHGVQIPR